MHLQYMTPSFVAVAIACLCGETIGFSVGRSYQSKASSKLHAIEDSAQIDGISRRQLLQKGMLALPALLMNPQVSLAGTFTPGGTLVDRDVGVTVGNPEASPSRKVDNSNVLFSQDNYFKFGVAAPWIEADSTEFPKTMPFVLSQQRYDNLKKYGDRVKSGAEAVKGLEADIKAGNYASISNGDDPKYALRPLGLMANGFLASENTGTTNELLLARWYINEAYLRLFDISKATSESEALVAHDAAKKAINSYFAMMNRSISSKVGNKFDYI
jgi:hypothetical protein